MAYIVIEGATKEALATAVNTAKGTGLIEAGGVAVVAVRAQDEDEVWGNTVTFYQAMTDAP